MLIVFSRMDKGWSTAHKQEWGLFLLEHMIHNVAAM